MSTTRGVRAIRDLLVLVVAASTPANAQRQDRELHAEFLLGTAWNLPTPLIIRLPGTPEVRQRVRYSTHAFESPLYYAVRIGGGSINALGAPVGVELELLHHKLHVDDPAPPVEHFEVSHGYNLLSGTLLRAADRLTLRVGVGLVIAHPEGRIGGGRVGGSRRTTLGGGYHIAGASIQVGIGRTVPLSTGRTVAYVVPEAKLTASFARVPLGDDGGSVLVPNVAGHLLAGFGVRRSYP